MIETIGKEKFGLIGQENELGTVFMGFESSRSPKWTCKKVLSLGFLDTKRHHLKWMLKLILVQGGVMGMVSMGNASTLNPDEDFARGESQEAGKTKETQMVLSPKYQPQYGLEKSVSLEYPIMSKTENLENPQETDKKKVSAPPNQSSEKAQVSEAPKKSEPDAQDLTEKKLPEVLPEEVVLDPPRRGLPAPIDSPPFPSSEWQIGGTNIIGVPDTSETYTLMDALYKSPVGDALKKSRIKIYGWVNVGGNLSTSSKSNFPTAYNTFPNRVDLDQVLLRVERLPDTVQTDHVDWGFHISNIYGLDYRYTTAKGYFSNQLLRYNRQYGYDPLLVYGDIYIPRIAKGMNIRIGRYLSIPDIEAQLAPDNYMYTHSLMYSYDTYTQTGIVATTKLSDHWSVQLGMNAGNDIAPWTRGHKLTGLAGVQWISKNNNDSIYVVANGINDGRYAYNNIQEYVATWSHRFNPIVHTKTQGYFLYQRKVPASALPSGVSPGFAPTWALVNYLEFKLSKKAFISLRNEVMDDMKGQRTGYATLYTSHGIGLTYWFNKYIALRPELRFEQSYHGKAYDRGRKRAQFMAAMDLIYRF